VDGGTVDAEGIAAKRGRKRKNRMDRIYRMVFNAENAESAEKNRHLFCSSAYPARSLV
jgi:hypothetical protein